MDIRKWKKEILTIPNLLSLFRLALIPVYVVIYLNAREQGQYITAGAILAVSCLTDMVDGKIARRFGMISTVGKVLDPVADKATQFTLTLCLSLRYPVLRPVLGLFVIKEGFQLIAGIVALRNGKMLPGALLPGKICTTVLFVSLILLVLFPGLPHTAVTAVAVVDAVFMMVSFVSYILAYFGKNSKVEDLKKPQ